MRTRSSTNDDPEALALAALGWTLSDDGAGAAAARADRARRRRRCASGSASRTCSPRCSRFLEAHEPDLLACADALGVVAGRAGRGAAEAWSDERRPLLITDCDDVLLHLVSHFADWVAEAHGLTFACSTPRASAGALTRRATAQPVAAERVWPLLDGFFDERDAPPAPGRRRGRGAARDRRERRHRHPHQYRRPISAPNRIAQLERFDIRHRVLCNQGGKGRPVLELIEEMRPERDRVRRRSRRSTTNRSRSTRPRSGGCT